MEGVRPVFLSISDVGRSFDEAVKVAFGQIMGVGIRSGVVFAPFQLRVAPKASSTGR